MSAPSPTVSGSPTGKKLGQGYPSRIYFSLFPNVDLWPISITPVSAKGRPPIDTTTQFNAHYETEQYTRLTKLGEGSMTALYNPDAFTTLFGAINVTQTITEVNPDSSSLCYFGAITEVTRGELKMGTLAQMTVKWSGAMADPTTCEEEGPVFTPGSGTHCVAMLWAAAAAAIAAMAWMGGLLG